MPRYSYRALSAAGQVERGDIEAPDLPAATRALQTSGATILRLAPAAKNRLAGRWLTARAPRLTRAELTDTTRELAAMLAAGQDIDVALRAVTDAAPNRRAAAVLTRLRDAVRDGASLTAALARDPHSFPRLYVGLIRAGEAGGNLAETCERLAALLERGRSLNAAIISALIYPAILLVAATGSIVLLLTQVLPQFVPLFAENDVPLPPSTAFLLAAGDALEADGPYLALAAIAVMFVARVALRRPGIRLAVDAAILRLPIAGGLLKDIAAARFCRVFGALTRNGVPLLAALGVAQEAMGNRHAEAAIATAAAAAKGGGGIARSLAGSNVFPARAVALIRLGEDTAQLGPMCLRAADLFEERIRLGLNRLVALLVPIITIAMGAAVAGIVSSLLLAMLSLNDVAQ